MRPGLGVSDQIVQMVGDSLIVPGGFLMPSTAALGGGKLIALYFRYCCLPLHGTQSLALCSAHWCPPCRQFTPQLSAFFQQMRAVGKPLEVCHAYLNHLKYRCCNHRLSLSRPIKMKGVSSNTIRPCPLQRYLLTHQPDRLPNQPLMSMVYQP